MAKEGEGQNLSNRQYVKEALQNDFVRNVKKKNLDLQREIKENLKVNHVLKKKCLEKDKKIKKLQDLVDMLINKKPEMTMDLDALSRDLLIANATISIQNLSLVQTVSNMQILELQKQNSMPPNQKEMQAKVVEHCSKIGFKYSGTYLTRGNLEVQVYGKEEKKQDISSIYESRKNSLMQRRMTQKNYGLFKSGQASYLENSKAMFNQSLLSNNPENLESKISSVKPQTSFLNPKNQVQVSKVQSKEEISQNILLSKQSTGNKISFNVDDASQLINVRKNQEISPNKKGIIF